MKPTKNTTLNHLPVKIYPDKNKKIIYPKNFKIKSLQKTTGAKYNFFYS